MAPSLDHIVARLFPPPLRVYHDHYAFRTFGVSKRLLGPLGLGLLGLGLEQALLLRHRWAALRLAPYMCGVGRRPPQGWHTACGLV